MSDAHAESLANETSDTELTPADRAALTALTADYAIATDAIVGGDIETGERLYRRVFTKDATFASGFDEAAPLIYGAGLDAWLKTVEEAVAGMVASQHLVGAGTFEIRPERAVCIVAPFQATTMFGIDKTMTTVLGTYYNEARRVGGEWRLTRSFAKYIAVHTSTRDAP